MNTEKKGKNKKNNAANSQKKVITAAFELFSSRGYAQTSVDSIAAKAKVSKGLIYYYFNSKEDILKGIFESLMQEIERAYPEKEDTTPIQALGKLVEDSFRFITRQTKLFRLMIALTAQPEVVKGLGKELEFLKKKWMEKLAKTFESLGYEQPEMEVYQLCAIFDGIGMAYISMKDYPIQDLQHFVEKKYGIIRDIEE